MQIDSARYVKKHRASDGELSVHPTAMLDLKPEQPSKSSSPEYSLKKEESDQKIKTEVTNLAPEPKISESKIVPAERQCCRSNC